MGIELFHLWRFVLIVVCTIYTAIRLTQTAWRWQEILWAGTRTSGLMRHYLFVHLLRLRVHRFTLEMIQIAALLVALLALSWAHRFV